MADFTKAQQDAINEQSKTLLVSAAAGSGKTTTLIARIIHSITRRENPLMLDKLLVVTFTKATANELRLKISKAVSDAITSDPENELLAKQFALLPSAKISTIDSFFLNLVRSNYTALGISPDFRTADEGESVLLANEIMETLINECFENKDSKICGGPDGFANLVDTIVGSGDDRRLVDTFLSLYTKLSSFPKSAATMYDCENDLREYAKRDFFESPHGKRIEENISGFFEYYKKGYLHALSLIQSSVDLSSAYAEIYEDDFHNLLAAEKALKDGYEASKKVIESIEFRSLKGTKYKGEKNDDFNYVRALRDEYKGRLKTDVKNYLTADINDLTDSLITTADICHKIGDFLCEYERRAYIEKKRLGIYDFSDITHFALKLLVDEDGNDTPLALAQKKLYDAVYIDEYQDVNAVQDRVFEAVSTKTNRFLVGDIKQSIYGFRGADPSIFAHLRSSFPLYEKDSSDTSGVIYMSENFRCNKEVISFTNMIFDLVMPLVSPDMNYTKGDSLVFGKTCKKDERIPTNVILAEVPPKDSADDGENPEAHYIAKEICRLVKEETNDNGEPLTYSDIAILIRSPKGKMDIYANTLRAYGIPVFTETNENLLTQSEVEIILCLLDAIDNPRRDIPLTGALLSPLYNVDCDFLASLRKGVKNERVFSTLKKYLQSDASDENREKIERFVFELSEFRSMARFMSAGELIDEIYNRYAIYARLSASNKLRLANLAKFRDLAHSFSGATPHNLSEFLRYIKNIESSAKKGIPAATPAETGNAVSILSIHKSKGLEFPVVFVADTKKRYNFDDTIQPILYSSKAGFAMQLCDESGFGVYNPLLRKSIALAMCDNIKEEELRLLYVALTRAKERLYVTASVTNPTKTLQNARNNSTFASKYAVSKLNSYRDVILYAAKGESNEFLNISTVPYLPFDVEAPVVVPVIDEENSVAKNTEILNERFDFEYPHKARTKIPAKLAISRLYPDILDDAVLPDAITQKKMPKAAEAPKFIAKSLDDSAKRGTATHLFMQFFDFENAAENGAAAELERLKEKRFISEEDAALVNLDEVDIFLASPLFAQMRNSKKLYREQRFNLNLKASDFAADEGLKQELSGETVLVQGVIDCFFYDENGDIILLDYKTDRVFKNDIEKSKEKLRETHLAQLKYYARAIEEICGKRPKKTLIFSLCLGDTVEV
ncbi:MAG: UvrD-helicase domain-containing protein [Clostridia bacterium]|nr:UvrD-helicase domain-containing protein [Clostridia bacterium]